MLSYIVYKKTRTLNAQKVGYAVLKGCYKK